MKSITLDKLLIGPQKVEVPGYGVTLYVKPLTQIDRDLSQGAARRASRELRRLLEDRSTEEYQLLVEDEIAEYSTEDLRSLWVSARIVEKTLEIQRKSLEDRDKTYVPEPEGEDATPASLDRYENEVEDIEQQREDSVIKQAQAARKALMKESESKTEDELRDLAKPDLIETILSREWQQEFAVQMILRGTYEDAKATKFAFKTPDQVRQLRPDTLEFLAQSHYGLMVDPEELKASGGETKSSI